MAGQIINCGKGVWLVRVYLGTDPETRSRASLGDLWNGKSTPQSTPRPLLPSDVFDLTALE
jgi:hypothetical protein